MRESKTPLWKHQEEARQKAWHKDGFALFADPGTGKTRTILSILCDIFHERRRILNTLVLTPPVVIEQWQREAWEFPELPKGLVMALTGPNWKRLRYLEDNLKCGYNVIAITNYEALYNKALFERLKSFSEILVCDESSKLKDPTSKRSKLAFEIAKKCQYRYLASGTPILSSPMDIYQQFKIMDLGKTFGTNFYAFRAQHFVDKNATWKGSQNYFPKWEPKEDCNQSISEKIEPVSFHVKKQDAIDLPDMVKKEIFVEMSPEQKKAYQEMRDIFVTIVRDKACVADMVLTKLLRLQQIVSGFIKFDDETESEFYENPRLDALSDLLEEIAPVEKVIVWATFKKNYKQIKAVCDKLKLETAELTGDTILKANQIDRFQKNPDIRVMIANQMAGGIGVNLTAAGTAIYYSKSFSLEADVQSEARNYRGGSIDFHKKVTRIDLVCRDTVDEIINQAIREKIQTNDEILSLLRKKL